MAVDWFNSGNNGGNDIPSLMRALGGEVRKYSLLDKASDFAIDKVSGHSKLEDEARRLDILLKKKQLGMDIDDDQYQGLLNTRNIGNASTAYLMNSVPKHAIMRATYKNAYAVKDDLPSILDTFKGGLGHAGSSAEQPSFIRGITRFIGKR